MDMNYIEICVAALTLAGAAIPLAARRRPIELGAAPSATHRGGGPYLIALAVVGVAFGGFNLFYYREQLRSHADDVLFAIWLVLSMIAGMFVQVLAANYRARRRLFDISRDRLIFPLLFSVIVFYPIWAVAASAPRGFFVIHAAFLNGYFWESIVSTAKPPEQGS